MNREAHSQHLFLSLSFPMETSCSGIIEFKTQFHFETNHKLYTEQRTKTKSVVCKQIEMLTLFSYSHTLREGERPTYTDDICNLN